MEKSMKLITKAQKEKLLKNGQQTRKVPSSDHKPVVKLFTPDAQATWLLTELDPDDPDIGFGLCDLGMGTPELGYVRISELEGLRGPMGLPVERDRHFLASKTISQYTDDALIKQAITV